MKKIILILLVFILSGCSTKNPQNNQSNDKENQTSAIQSSSYVEKEKESTNFDALPEAVRVVLIHSAAQGIKSGTKLDLDEDTLDLEYYFDGDSLIIRDIPARTSMAATYYKIKLDKESIILQQSVSRNSTSLPKDLIIKKESLNNEKVSKIDLYATYLANKKTFDFGIKNVVSSIGAANGYQGLLKAEKNNTKAKDMQENHGVDISKLLNQATKNSINSQIKSGITFYSNGVNTPVQITLGNTTDGSLGLSVDVSHNGDAVPGALYHVTVVEIPTKEILVFSGPRVKQKNVRLR
ncbi:hypothetical protein ACWOAH_02845 [Vagococcus vulneris]|uniref:Lipoprotein n=1 Tax=Vagococcus vulneris TaxID=1977869 RepID=A0A430A0W4_9ENTE|nr:hypothetical protein [Vagococcus vulneris]RSU00014.1 hypothetical protein CBF37_01535 [Vagococcus vulneris]